MATEVERLSVLIEANTKSYERAMARIEQRTDRAIRASTRSVGSLDASLKSAAATARTFASAFGAGFLAGGLSALPSVIQGVVSQVASLGDAAQRIGLTTDQLQILQFQAQQNGSSAEALTTAMEQFSRRIAEAAQGSGDLAKILAANGIALRDAQGNLRPLIEYVREYADLISGASSEQDRLSLATDGFGRSGTEMVTVLAGGSAEMQEMEAAARRLGVVLSEDMVQSAMRLDDEFTLLAAQIGTGMQQAILGTLEAFRQFDAELYNFTTSAAGALGAAEALAKIRLTNKLNTGQLDQPFDVPGIARQPENPPLRVVVPIKPVGGGGGVGGSTRDSAAARAKREKEAVDSLIRSLETEWRLIGATDAERRLANELRRAGAAATDEQRATIEALVPAIEAEQNAYDVLVDRMDEVRSIAGDALGSFVDDIRSGAGAAEALQGALDGVLDRLIDIALQAAISGLFGAPGTSGGGLLGKAIAGIVSGGRAGGGPVSPGRVYKVGERGPELFSPGAPGRIVPNGKGGGELKLVVNNNNGSRIETAERQGPSGREIEIRVEKMVDDRMKNRYGARPVVGRR